MVQSMWGPPTRKEDETMPEQLSNHSELPSSFGDIADLVGLTAHAAAVHRVEGDRLFIDIPKGFIVVDLPIVRGVTLLSGSILREKEFALRVEYHDGRVHVTNDLAEEFAEKLVGLIKHHMVGLTKHNASSEK